MHPNNKKNNKFKIKKKASLSLIYFITAHLTSSLIFKFNISNQLQIYSYDGYV